MICILLVDFLKGLWYCKFYEFQSSFVGRTAYDSNLHIFSDHQIYDFKIQLHILN